MEFLKLGEKEKITQEEVRKEKGSLLKEFIEKEDTLLERTGGFLASLAPEKYKKKATALLAAFSLFASASSVFAENGEKEITKEKLFPENYKMILDEESKKNETAPFDWRKIADQIAISIGGKMENIPDLTSEIIESSQSYNYDNLAKTELYKNLSNEEFDKINEIFSNIFYDSEDAESFFAFLDNQKEGLDDGQKVLFLQRLGNLVAVTYNYDMLENKDTIEISSDKIYEAIKDLYINKEISKTGMCGNLSVFIEKTAKSLGMEAFLQSASMGGINDISSGVVADIDGRKQIIFFTYFGEAVSTGTLNLEKARGIFERAYKSVGVFNSFVGNDIEVLFPVESLAQKEIKKAAGFEKTEEMLDKNLEQGKINEEHGLEINISPESKEIKFSKDSIVLAYYNYQNVYNNPYQSLDDLNALRFTLKDKGKKFGAEADITTIFMSIKDLYGDNVFQNDIVGRLVLEGMESRELTKGDFGRIVLNIGATLQAGLRLPMDATMASPFTRGKMGEAAGGVRLMYYDMKNNNFYIGADVLGREQSNDFQNQDLIIKEALDKITVGSSINVYEAIVDLKAAKGFADWGKSLELSSAVKIKSGFELGGKYEKEKSEYETLKPSSEKIGLEVGWNGPKWKFVISGAKIVEQYSEAEKEKSYDIQAKVNIFVF